MELKEEKIKRLEHKYDHIVQLGHAFFLTIEKVPKQRGQTKIPKSTVKIGEV